MVAESLIDSYQIISNTKFSQSYTYFAFHCSFLGLFDWFFSPIFVSINIKVLVKNHSKIEFIILPICCKFSESFWM